jgi:hypothetical protein
LSSGLDVSGLAPEDAIAALRSFPRRFAALLELDEGDDPGVLRPVVEQLDRAGRDLAVLGAAVEAALVQDDPVLHPAVLDESAREYPDVAEVDAESALDLLRVEGDTLADRAAHVSAAAWGRKAKVAGDGEVTALDVLREAVRTTANHLRAAEKTRGR